MTSKVVVSTQTWLPNSITPSPATIEINSEGKIISIHNSIKSISAFPDLLTENYNDLGDLWLLPGVSYQLLFGLHCKRCN